jgi:hypothetical protein
MVMITISNLYPHGTEQMFRDLTESEMQTIEGGYRRRRRQSSTVNSPDVSNLLQEIDKQVKEMNIELGKTTDSLNGQFDT